VRLRGEAGGDVKSGEESGGPLGGGFIEHHDLCFFMVDAHTWEELRKR